MGTFFIPLKYYKKTGSFIRNYKNGSFIRNYKKTGSSITNYKKTRSFFISLKNDFLTLSKLEDIRFFSHHFRFRNCRAIFI